MNAKLTLAALGATLLLTGCLDSSTPDAKAVAAELPPCNPNPEIRVIVADIDSAFNPYHQYFHAGSDIYKNCTPSSVTPEVLAALGVPPENVLELTRTGNIVKDKKADEAIWKRIRPTINPASPKLYWYKGTNVIAGSFDIEPHLIPDVAKSPHGTGTAASVLAANPDAIIVFAETWNNLANDTSHDFAFLHKEVDIITTSYGFSVPSVGFPLPEATTFRNTYEAVVRLGKLHFSSGGNGSGSTPHRAGAGPWWSIGVSGNEEGSTDGDQQGVSGNFPDFVSDFTQDIPYCMDCEKGLSYTPGTSFSTPRAAGVASKVLLEARRALGHTGGIRINADGTTVMAEGNGKTISNWQLRRALEEGAYAGYNVNDYDPTVMADDPWPTSTPVVNQAGFLQIGWGDLTADPEKGVVAGALGVLGIGTTPAAKPAAFCDFQTKVVEHRITYWSTIALEAADHPADPMPFEFCGSSLPSTAVSASTPLGGETIALPGFDHVFPQTAE